MGPGDPRAPSPRTPRPPGGRRRGSGPALGQCRLAAQYLEPLSRPLDLSDAAGQGVDLAGDAPKVATLERGVDLPQAGPNLDIGLAGLAAPPPPAGGPPRAGA